MNEDLLVWRDEDDDDRAIDGKPPWWKPAKELSWGEADELDEILDIE